MGGDDKFLVYEHRAGDSGKEALKTMTRQELNDVLNQNPSLQATTKATNGKSSITVYQHDLYTGSQKTKYAHSTPNYEVTIADVDIGLIRAMRYSELTILSKNKD